MKKVDVAIIGAGTMCQEHAKVFSALPDVNLVGLYSRTRSRAEAIATKFNIPTIADSIDELYQKTKADLLIITVPELQANAVAKKSFSYPWKILMEKPVGYNLLDAKDILNEANKNNAHVMVGLNRRFYSSVQSALKDLSTCNDKRFIHVQDQQSAEEARYHGHPEKVVENFMYANSIHNIDLILAFARGKITRIQSIKPWCGEATEVVLSHIEFDSGDTALYEGLWRGPGPWAFSISTMSRRWVLQPLEIATKQGAGERKQQLIEIDPIDKEYKAGLYLQAQEIIKAVRNEVSRAVSLQKSFYTMQLIHDIFYSNSAYFSVQEKEISGEVHVI